MPQQVGVRELKNDTSQIIRMVREERAEYVVTYRGQPVAVILPVAESASEDQIEQILAASRPDDDFWAQWDALGKEIDAQWKSEKTAVELISEQRR
ncbi:MAG: type II toxin-antitoxin system Phd/YefM family antitoxin [Anaerolineae bacterium]|nr:type II toxin-antitoxin system Phd/YefM family antitoxin [Anaerolineae bacterium]MCB0201291.1 type II toxin-antitoxin system Phd/YefM family antitoxin [Anaerolineae bacterium]MCB0205754.1 type II toxin-antitoxin system Phd/YefM family antitoxin [Anaerolineae bacterium]MCB0255335.1 type II toxin-antitoxin system Phd/YefM family antitoxin [Anaerolineae bacterium]